MVTASSGWVASSLARWVCSRNRGRGQSLRAAGQGLSPMGAERKVRAGFGPGRSSSISVPTSSVPVWMDAVSSSLLFCRAPRQLSWNVP